MRKLSLIGLLIGATIFTGCSSTDAEIKQREQNDIIKYYYVKDPRTNLCFMSYLSGSSSGFITNVPCTPEVENLIKKY